MSSSIIIRLTILVALVHQGLTSVGKAGTPPSGHPLDPLTVDEINTAIAVIESNSKFPSGAFFPIVTLKEPRKDEVLDWRPGKSFKRQAFANVYNRGDNQLFEVTVDLIGQKVVSWIARPGLQPAVGASEFGDADAVARADTRWRKAMKRRGINPDDVYLDVWAPGDVLLPSNAKPGDRLLRALSFFRGPLPNPYDRPIEGVVVTMDMNKMKVIDVLDTGIRPVNQTLSGSSATTRTGLQPLVVTQPNGPSFRINGNAVTWQSWHFRVGYNSREGLVLYQIGYEQNNVVRPIIYRIALDEIYVPYALPDQNWAWRTALDLGEYNLGQYAEELAPNVDVPNNAIFFDEAAASDLGSAGGGGFSLPSAIAMYERPSFFALWDRADPTTLVRDTRFGRELVVTASYPIGNYTYAVGYIFRTDGGLDVRVGATGTTLNEGVNTTADVDANGTNVATNIAAPSHQHFFNFRIDFDVDGTKNQLVEENVHNVASSTKNAFISDDAIIGRESFRDLTQNRSWRVESTSRKTALGKPTTYEIVPADSTVPYSDSDYVPLQHAAFVTHQLWVTRYRDGELYAAGDYPNQGPVGEGVPKYIAGGESLPSQDLVVWYTMGFTHVPTVEEFPVMTTENIGFALRPSGFFDQNPALDAP
jgi:primary-amine oxidase